jgi:hypothetical protein
LVAGDGNDSIAGPGLGLVYGDACARLLPNLSDSAAALTNDGAS